MLVTLDSYLQLSGDHQPAVPLARDSEPESVRYGLDSDPQLFNIYQQKLTSIRILQGLEFGTFSGAP